MLVRAVAIEPERRIAVEAEHSESVWPSYIFEMLVELVPSSKLSPIFCSTTLNVIDG